MKHLILSLLLIFSAIPPTLSQDQRLRAPGSGIPEPAEYWEELEPLQDRPSVVLERVEAPRVKPNRTPVWQTRYTLGPGDILDFSVYDRPDLARENIQIAPDGTVSYLQAVGVRAQGLTLDQLRTEIEGKLADYQAAKVIISPVSIASKDFTIIGRVRKPGSYSLDRPTSILEAISLAQGIETGNLRGSAFELADFERSFVAREGRKLDVDLGRLYYEGDLSQNAFLEPDDYIYIASSLKNEIYVLGAVGDPGRRKMPVRLTVTQAIAEAGGFDEYAYKARVLLIRGSIHQPETTIIDMRDILAGRARDIELENRDIVFVNERPFQLVERVLDDAVFTFLQTVSTEAVNADYRPIFGPN